MFQHLKHMAFNLQERGATADLPSTWAECRTCASASANPQPVKVITSPQYHNPYAAIELLGRVNEADIFVGDIWVTGLIDTKAQVSTITWDFCEGHGYNIHPVKQMLHLEGTWGFTIPYLGYVESTVRFPPIKDCDVSQWSSWGPPPLIVWGSPFSMALLCWIGLWAESLWKSWLMPATLGNRPTWKVWSLPKWLAQLKWKMMTFPPLMPLLSLLNPLWFLPSNANV